MTQIFEDKENIFQSEERVLVKTLGGKRAWDLNGDLVNLSISKHLEITLKYSGEIIPLHFKQDKTYVMKIKSLVLFDDCFKGIEKLSSHKNSLGEVELPVVFNGIHSNENGYYLCFLHKIKEND